METDFTVLEGDDSSAPVTQASIIVASGKVFCRMPVSGGELTDDPTGDVTPVVIGDGVTVCPEPMQIPDYLVPDYLFTSVNSRSGDFRASGFMAQVVQRTALVIDSTIDRPT